MMVAETVTDPVAAETAWTARRWRRSSAYSGHS